MLILETVAPVFLVVVIGVVLERLGVLSPAFTQGANKFVYRLGLPALLFRELAAAGHDFGRVGWLIAVLLSATVLMIALGYGVSFLLRVRPEARGTFVHAGYRGNLAYIALPIVYTLPEAAGDAGLAFRTQAILALAPTVLFYNASAVAVLVASQHAVSWSLPGRIVRESLKNPVLLGCVAGMVWAMTEWQLPVLAEQTLKLLAQSALPLALLCIGTALAESKIVGTRQLIAAASALKILASPLIGYGIARLAGLSDTQTALAVLYLTTPSAAAGYTMVTQLGGDEKLAASTIVVTTIASAPALALVVALLGS